MGAAEWLAAGSPLELGFLPFPLDQALLPGETRQVHLYEARFITLFSEAASKHHDCLGAVLFTPQGNVASVTSLLEIEEFRTGAEEIGVWANLKCVGRVKLKELETTEFDYLSGGVELFTDSLPTEERAEDDAAAAELRELHASVREMEERLTKAGEGAAVAEATGREARVEWGHEVRDGSEEAGLGLEVRDCSEIEIGARLQGGGSTARARDPGHARRSVTRRGAARRSLHCWLGARGAEERRAALRRAGRAAAREPARCGGVGLGRGERGGGAPPPLPPPPRTPPPLLAAATARRRPSVHSPLSPRAAPLSLQSPTGAAAAPLLLRVGHPLAVGAGAGAGHAQRRRAARGGDGRAQGAAAPPLGTARAARRGARGVLKGGGVVDFTLTLTLTLDLSR